MVAVGGDGVVILAHEREGADGDGFLSDVKMEEPAHFPLLVEFERGLLEAADAEHVGEEAEFLLGGEVGVDRGLGVVDRAFTGFFGLFGSGDAHVRENRVGYGLRLDRGCERRFGALAGKGQSGESCGFWQIEMAGARQRWRLQA